MVKFNPKERPSFSNVFEVLKNHLNATSSWSSFPFFSKTVKVLAEHLNTTLRSWSPFSSMSGKALLNYILD
jgi:hypothetical protein